MVLPPSQLKELISEASNAKGIFDLLRRHGLLSSKGRRSKKEILEVIKSSASASSQREPMPGPSGLDNLAAALQPFLNERGLEAYHSYPASPLPESVRWWHRIIGK